MTRFIRHPHGTPPLCVFALALTCLAACGGSDIDYSGPVADWAAYGAVGGGGRYSPLTQVTAANVDDLEVAWVYHTGDYADGSTGLAPSSFQNTPIVVDGTMYICTPRNRVIALDPNTGEERWAYDPGTQITSPVLALTANTLPSRPATNTREPVLSGAVTPPHAAWLQRILPSLRSTATR